MRVLIFLIYLCFVLLGGYNCIYADTHHNTIYYSQNNYNNKAPRAKFINTDNVNPLVDPSEEETDYLIGDDLEDEDPNDSYARKYRLLTRRWLTPPNTFFSNYLCSGFKDRAPLSSLFDYKYIKQRALRI